MKNTIKEGGINSEAKGMIIVVEARRDRPLTTADVLTGKIVARPCLLRVEVVATTRRAVVADTQDRAIPITINAQAMVDRAIDVTRPQDTVEEDIVEEIIETAEGTIAPIVGVVDTINLNPSDRGGTKWGIAAAAAAMAGSSLSR